MYLRPYAMGAGGPILLKPSGVLLWQCIETCSIAIKVGMNTKYGSSPSHYIKTVLSTSKDTITQHNSWLHTHTHYCNTHTESYNKHAHTHCIPRQNKCTQKLIFAMDAEFIDTAFMSQKTKQKNKHTEVIFFCNLYSKH